MKKCFVCTICSWLVGLATLVAAGLGLLGHDLPGGVWAAAVYAVLALIALGFLYYQITPCPRCQRRR